MEAIDQLSDDNPAAAQLLCVCAVLHPAPLPVEVLTPGLPALPRPLGAVAPSSLPAVVETLTTHGLAASDATGVTIPDQVRDAVRDDLGPDAVRVCRSYAGTLIAAAAPAEVENPETWPRWAALAPHLIAADAAHSSDPALRSAAHRLVASLLHRGKPRPARTIAAELHAAWSADLGPDHPDTLTAAHELARALLAAGALLPARALLEDTVNRMINALGPSHPQTLATAATRRGALLRLGGAPGKTLHRHPRRRT